MARPKVRRTTVRKKGTKARRRSAPSAGSAALARARARIAELEAENRRLQEELAGIRGEPMGDEGSDENDAPLAPGM